MEHPRRQSGSGFLGVTTMRVGPATGAKDTAHMSITGGRIVPDAFAGVFLPINWK